MTGIDRKIVIDDFEATYIMEYLQLILDNDKIIDDKYDKEMGYKVYGHIKSIIEQLDKKCNITDKK